MSTAHTSPATLLRICSRTIQPSSRGRATDSLRASGCLPNSPSSSTARSYSSTATAIYRPRCASAVEPSTSLTSRRSFFSLPDISKLAKLAGSAAEAVGNGSGGEGQVQTDGTRQTYHARKILPYSQEQLYNIVADVPSYSSFIPFCSSSVVFSPDTPSPTTSRSTVPQWTPPPDEKPFEVDAELKVGFGGFDEAYVSRVKGTPYESVSASAGEAALFKSLSTTWSFAPASARSPHPSTTIPSPSDLPTPSVSSAPDTSRGPTLLTIDLAFEFTNPLHRIASQAVLPKVADKMVDAFERRCLEVYGKGRD